LPSPIALAVPAGVRVRRAARARSRRRLARGGADSRSDRPRVLELVESPARRGSRGGVLRRAGATIQRSTHRERSGRPAPNVLAADDVHPPPLAARSFSLGNERVGHFLSQERQCCTGVLLVVAYRRGGPFRRLPGAG